MRIPFDHFEIVFPDERSVSEAPDRGYLSHVIVEMRDGSRFPACFINIQTLREDLDQYSKLQQRFIAEVGMIVVPDLSLDTLTSAIATLFDRGYFKHFQTIDESPDPWSV